MSLIPLHSREASRLLILKQSDKVSAAISFSSLQSSHCSGTPGFGEGGLGQPGQGRGPWNWLWGVPQTQNPSWPHSRCFRNAVPTFCTGLGKAQTKAKQPNQSKPRQQSCTSLLFSVQTLPSLQEKDNFLFSFTDNLRPPSWNCFVTCCNTQTPRSVGNKCV